MKRLHPTCALAWLLAATCAHAAAQTSSAGIADPRAPVPPTRAQPAIEYHADPAAAAGPAMPMPMPMPMPMHAHHAGMDMGAMPPMAGGGMQGMQCMASGGDKKSCCADMKMKDGGTCCDHADAGAQQPACKPGCCGHEEVK
jgi:hypothetical protein